MNVIFNTADRQGYEVMSSGDAADVLPKPCFEFWHDGTRAIFRTENNMEEQ